jgi:hypothetical protein
MYTGAIDASVVRYRVGLPILHHNPGLANVA